MFVNNKLIMFPLSMKDKNEKTVRTEDVDISTEWFNHVEFVLSISFSGYFQGVGKLKSINDF